MNAVASYFGNIWKGLSTAAVGMSITARYLFRKPITVQYPDEEMPRSDRFRGIHILDQDNCGLCKQCQKACPVDCITIEGKRDKKTKVIDWVQWSIDYRRCMFCELCVHPCPTNCLVMGGDFALVTQESEALVLDLLSWKGVKDPPAADSADSQPSTKPADSQPSTEAAGSEPGKASKEEEPKSPGES